jgi:hypothetical protein
VSNRVESPVRFSKTALTLACAWLAAANARAPLLALGPLLSLVIADLHLSFTVAGLLSGLPLLLMGASGLPGGWLAARPRHGPGALRDRLRHPGQSRRPARRSALKGHLPIYLSIRGLGWWASGAVPERVRDNRGWHDAAVLSQPSHLVRSPGWPHLARCYRRIARQRDCPSRSWRSGPG